MFKSFVARIGVSPEKLEAYERQLLLESELRDEELQGIFTELKIDNDQLGGQSSKLHSSISDTACHEKGVNWHLKAGFLSTEQKLHALETGQYTNAIIANDA